MKLSTKPSIAGGFLLMFGGVIAAAFITGDKDLARQLGQGLLNIVIGLGGYYFGSSEGSRNKDDAMAKALRSAAPSAPTDPQP